jgi:hypothetical protein
MSDGMPVEVDLTFLSDAQCREIHYCPNAQPQPIITPSQQISRRKADHADVYKYFFIAESADEVKFARNYRPRSNTPMRHVFQFRPRSNFGLKDGETRDESLRRS